jgi:uncharacterized protein YdaU (DUF1376 family)
MIRMSPPWMPWYWGDYHKDTQDLDTTQHGAYMLLIGHYWQHGGLPDCDRELATIAKLSEYKWKKMRETIAKKFKENWRHKRIDAELLKAEHKIIQRSIAGARGGFATAIARAKAVPIAAATGLAKTQQPSANHNSNITTSLSVAAREDSANGRLQASEELLELMARKSRR